LSRLHGHSSSSGAARVPDDVDPLVLLERKLLESGAMERSELEQIHAAAKEEIEAAVKQAMSEPRPTAANVYDHTYAPSPVDAVYPEDYTGLPT
jgi:2-oxoisovalerate dehydrogenase E1 component alpha subunit